MRVLEFPKEISSLGIFVYFLPYHLRACHQPSEGQKSRGRVRVESRSLTTLVAGVRGLANTKGVALDVTQRSRLPSDRNENGPPSRAVRLGVAGPVRAGSISRWLAFEDLSHDALVKPYSPKIKRKAGCHRCMTYKALTAIAEPRPATRSTSVSGVHLAPETICRTACEPERIARPQCLTAFAPRRSI